MEFWGNEGDDDVLVVHSINEFVLWQSKSAGLCDIFSDQSNNSNLGDACQITCGRCQLDINATHDWEWKTSVRDNNVIGFSDNFINGFFDLIGESFPDHGIFLYFEPMFLGQTHTETPKCINLTQLWDFKPCWTIGAAHGRPRGQHCTCSYPAALGPIGLPTHCTPRARSQARRWSPCWGVGPRWSSNLLSINQMGSSLLNNKILDPKMG